MTRVPSRCSGWPQSRAPTPRSVALVRRWPGSTACLARTDPVDRRLRDRAALAIRTATATSSDMARAGRAASTTSARPTAPRSRRRSSRTWPALRVVRTTSRSGSWRSPGPSHALASLPPGMAPRVIEEIEDGERQAGKEEQRSVSTLAAVVGVHLAGSLAVGAAFRASPSPMRTERRTQTEHLVTLGRPARILVASEPVLGPVGMCGFDRAWLPGNASRGCCSGLVNQAAKRSTWQPPVDSRPRCLGSKVSVEATSASRVVEASCSGAAIRTSVT